MSAVLSKPFSHCMIILQVQNCFRVKEDTPFGTKTPIPKQKDIRPKPLLNTNDIINADTVEAAAAAAAGQIADAENKSFVAAEAVKEAERISRMAEDTDSLLQLAKEIFERCNIRSLIPLPFLVITLLISIMYSYFVSNITGSQGEIVLMA